MTALDSYSHDVCGEKEFGFAQAINVGDTIYVSGQLSHDDEGNFLHPDHFDAQLQQSYANFEQVLSHYGATRNQVVSETQFIVDLPKYKMAMATSNLAHFGDHHRSHVKPGAGRGSGQDRGGDGCRESASGQE
ncbi:RidA family protein [Streptomyces sp. NBC_01314]|uniref:RidA family protein n=1 Tax=Streptomyces sp. NBC_01314 TaxID=2903821 RepID=UPI00308658C3|nr:RidA family protein [Streptomyces sp. NBC_01314]